MVCLRRGQDGSSGSASVSGFTSTLALALFSWATSKLFPPGGDLRQPGSAAQAALNNSQGRCEVELGEEFQWRCGMEVNIFTEMEPEDLYAMAALFRKANEIAIELRCRPEEYPIKAVYGGGGYNSDFWHLHLQYYLAILQTHGIVPDPRMFDIHTQAYKGPTSLEHEKNCYDIFPDGTPTPPTHRAMLGEQTTLSSVKATIGPIMEQLRSQSAPIIVALRPLYEFAILWTEYSLNQTQPRFEPTRGYEQVMRGNDSHWANDIENVAASLLAFQRSRIAMYQGDGDFARMGTFFREKIQDRARASVLENVSQLEETFVTWPRQFLVVNRGSILANERRQKMAMFDGHSQPEIFRALARSPALSSLLGHLTIAWNHAVASELLSIVRHLIDADGPSDRLGETMLLEGLVRLYFHRLHYPHLAHTQEFFSGASDLAQRLSDMMERQLRGRRVPGALSLPKRVVMRWAQYAWLGDSGVAANGILLPFCLDRRSNLVRESFRKVTYGGLRNTDWRYVWPDAPYSASTVWFTNTSTLPGDAAVDPDERERRMHREIKELYISAVTPLVVG